MDQSLSSIWDHMSLPVKGIMFFMLGMSIYMLYRVVDRLVVFTKASSETVRFVLEPNDAQPIAFKRDAHSSAICRRLDSTSHARMLC